MARLLRDGYVRADFTLARPVIMSRLPFAAEAAGGAAGGAGGGAGAGGAPAALATVVGCARVRGDDGAEAADVDAPAAAAAMAEVEAGAPAAGSAAVEADAPAAGGAGDSLPGKLAR
jgi:hypothetical protein